jgi:hypothetical protein
MDYSPHTGPTRPRVVAPGEPPAGGPGVPGGRDAHLREAMLARVGEVIPGGWRLDRLLAVGSTAVLFGGADSNGRHAVLKLMRPELAADPLARKRFHHEAELLAGVSHAGLATIYDHGLSARGEPFLVLEQLVGETVHSYWSRHERGVGFQPVLRMMVPVLQALLACHERGITYLNVSPANIFLVKGGGVKLLDFGLAQRARVRGPVAASQANPGFMAPEQALDVGDYGPPTDIFGVGATMFALLAGAPLHEGEDSEERRVTAATTPAPPLLSVAPLLPREVGELVDHALAWSPSERFGNTRQMGQALVGMLERLAELEEEAQQATSASLAGDIPPGLDASVAPLGVLAERHRGAAAAFGQLQRLLDTVLEVGWDDERVANLRGRCLGTLRGALESRSEGLEIELWPGHFGPAQAPLWRPAGRCVALAERLYGAGMRAMVLEPEVDDAELERWCRFLGEVAGSAAGPTPMARFEAARFERIGARLCVPLASLPALGEAAGPLASLLQLLDETASFWLGAERTPAAGGGDVSSIEDGKVAALRARVASQGERLWPHLPPALARADAFARPRAAQRPVVEGVAKLAASWLEAGRWFDLASFWGALDEALAPEARAEYAAAALPPARLEALLALLVAAPAQRAETDGEREGAGAGTAASPALAERGITRLLAALGADPADAVVARLPRVRDGHARAGLLGYVLEHLDGREAGLAPLLHADAEPETVTTLLDALGRHDGPSALAALRQATQHPDARVWQRALGLRLQRGGGEPLRDLRRLLVERDAPTRLVVLDLIERYRVTSVGEVLAERIHDATFLEASDEERRRLMDVLAHIDPVRAEEVCVEVLKRRGLVASKARDSSRLLAAEYLGTLGRGEEALDALAYATKPRWWNSRELQTVATRSHSLVTTRMAEERRR